MILAARACTGILATAGLLLVLAVAVVGGEQNGARSPMPQRTIAEVLSQQTDRFMALPGVVGVAEGQCDGRSCIKVFVKKKTAEVLGKIPSAVEGYPVSIEETDEFRAFNR